MKQDNKDIINHTNLDYLKEYRDELMSFIVTNS